MATKVIQAQTAYLASEITTTSTEIPVKGFFDINRLPIITMPDSIQYMVLEPKSKNNQEIISFTGITVLDVTLGKVKLTGVTRGLMAQPEANGTYIASPSLAKAHAGNVEAILADTPQLWDKKVDKDTQSIPTLYTFTQHPISTDPSTPSGNQLTPMSFVQALINGVNNTITSLNNTLTSLINSKPSGLYFVYGWTHTGQNGSNTITISHNLGKVPKKVTMKVLGYHGGTENMFCNSDGVAFISDNGNGTGTVTSKMCVWNWSNYTSATNNNGRQGSGGWLALGHLVLNSYTGYGERDYKINSVTSSQLVIGYDYTGAGDITVSLPILVTIEA